MARDWVVSKKMKAFSPEQLVGANSLIRDGLNLSRGDKLLLLYQNEFSRAAACISMAAKRLGIVVDLRQFNIVDFPLGCSVPALSSPAIPAGIVLLIEWSEVSNRARLGLLAELVDVNRGWRIASMPGVNLEDLSLCVCDFKEINEKCLIAFAVFARSTVAVLETKNPSDTTENLRIPIDDFLPENSTGQIARNAWGNFPSGETFVVPNPYAAEGWLTVRGSLSGRPLTPSEWVRFKVKQGRIVDESIEASSGVLLHDFRGMFWRPSGELKDENANALAEMGLGTNSHITRLVGNPIFDEKKLGTVHVSFGRNDQFMGPLKSSVYQAVICSEATLTLEGNLSAPVRLINNGEFLAREENATPHLASFDCLDQHALVRLGELDYQFSTSADVPEMSIEYVSQRESLRFVLATGDVATMAQQILTRVSNVSQISVIELTEDVGPKDPSLYSNIISGLVAYGILETSGLD